MVPAVGNRSRCVGDPIGAVLGLKPKLFKGKGRKVCRVQTVLGKDQFEVVTPTQQQRRASLRADTEPVNAVRRQAGSVGFDGDFKTVGVTGGDQGRVQLKQGFSAGKHHEPTIPFWAPSRSDRVGQCAGGFKTTAAVAIGAHEVGVAKPADGFGPIGLSSRPQVAAAQTAEDRDPTRLCPFALKGLKNFFHGDLSLL